MDVSGVTNGVWVLVGGLPNIEGLVALLLDANTDEGVERFIGELKEEGWLTAGGDPNIDVVVVGAALLNTGEACVGEDPKTEALWVLAATAAVPNIDFGEVTVTPKIDLFSATLVTVEELGA